MYKDEIINEVWENRKKFSEEHNHDIDAMVRDLEKRQNRSGRILVDRRKSPDKTAQTDSAVIAPEL